MGVLAAAGDRLVFTAVTSTDPFPPRNRLWISDGTSAGTFPLQLTNADTINGPWQVAVAGERIYVAAAGTNSLGSSLLWSTTGAQGDLAQLTWPSVAGTTDPNRLWVTNLLAAGDRLYFREQQSRQLYVVDAATNAVSAVGTTTINGPGVSLGGAALFMGSTGTASGLLSVTGTTTTLLALAELFSPSFFASSFTSAAGRVFIRGGNAGGLWVTDGTSAGTQQLTTAKPGLNPVAFRDGLAFVADDGVHGAELWFSNGTPGGTFLVADLNVGAGGSDPSYAGPTSLSVSGDKLFFLASNGSNVGVYSFEGAAGSVRQVAVSGLVGSPTSLSALGDGLRLGTADEQLWGVNPAGQATNLTAGGPTEFVHMARALGDKLIQYVIEQWVVTPGGFNFGPSGRLYVYDGATGAAQLIGEFTSLDRSRAVVADGRLYFQAGTDADSVELWVSDGTVAGTVRLTDTRGGDINSSALFASYSNLLRKLPTAGELDYIDGIAGKVSGGQMTVSAGRAELIDHADATTSVATLAYQFFTGSIPSAAGLDYLVSPTGANAANLNSAYYQSFSLENRYINFAVNLGKLGGGAAQFQATYGNLSLLDATKAAYAKIFGSAATDAKAHALIDSRIDYFAYYGQDGASGIGTKAAMVGWLLSEAVKADVGSYATANEAFLGDLADGAVKFAVDIVGVYGGTPFMG